MAKVIGVIVNGIEYDPYNLPQKVKEDLQNRLSEAAKSLDIGKAG